jgi:hypothetical protein
LKNEELNGDELYEEEVNDNGDMPTPRARTVAKLRASMSVDSDDGGQLPLIACRRCSQTDRPETLLICDACEDGYHLDCAKPSLLAVPRYEWHCELCEHKRLCVNLIEKLMQMIKVDERLTLKRKLMTLRPKQCAPKKPVVAPPVVRKVTQKRRVNTILSTDEEEKEEETKKKQKKTPTPTPTTVQPEKKYTNFLIDDYDEVESVAESKKSQETANVTKQLEQPPTPPTPQQPQQQEPEEEPGKRQMRSCRRQTKDYRCDDFDTKMTEAIIDVGLKNTQDDSDSGKHTLDNNMSR